MNRRALAFIVVGIVSGCSHHTDSQMTTPDMATPMRPALGMPFDAPKNTWTWIDFPDSQCDDGSPTGMGVNGGDGGNLLVFFNGGGACWDYLTCYMLNTATHGPYGKTEFDAQLAGASQTNTIFDRSDAANPFKDWSFVFIPYCTGDVHAGDNTMMYSDNSGMITKTYHHAGHANVLAFVPRIAGTWPQPGKLVVSGSSAGGFGASFNYDTFRHYYPTGPAYLIDDSGPTFEGDSLPMSYVSSWYTSWRLDKVLDPICGMQDCKSDLSLAVKLLASTYPNDRMSLLSSLQDQTIRSYFLQSPSGFQTALLMMAHDILDPTTNFRYFFVDGQTHTMLFNESAFTSQGTSLEAWLTQEVGDDAGWKSLKP
jgi:hypothetical protein